MQTIWKSRKFWLMLADVIVSMTTYFVGKYLNPATAQDVLFFIGAMQPVVILVIASITVQNVEAIKTQGAVNEARAYNERALPCPEIGESGEGVPIVKVSRP